MHTQEQVRERGADTARCERHAALRKAEFLPDDLIDACQSFREVVWLSWELRKRRGLTKAALAVECGLYASHVTQFVNQQPLDKKGKRRADLPASKVAAFEASVGNRGVSQYLCRVGQLTLMEEVIAKRA